MERHFSMVVSATLFSPPHPCLWVCQAESVPERFMAREDRQDPGGQFKHTSSAFPISFVQLKKIFQVIYAGHFTFIVISDFIVSLAVFTSSLLTFFFSHCSAPSRLPSPPVSCCWLAELCIFLACCSAVFCKGGDLFSSHVHFRDHTPPPTISVHLPPTFSSPNDF